MRRELHALERPEAVDPDRERSRGGYRRVLLPERARGGVARVRCELLAELGDARVQLAESGERHVDLAAHLRHRREAVGPHLQRHRPDGAQVHRHLLALVAVAARRSTREHAVLVGEVDREPVDLRLDHISDGLVGIESLAHVLGPLEQALAAGDLLERAHRRQVLHLLEALARRRADALRGRVRGDQVWMLVLERL
jgi:hypothetical protein